MISTTERALLKAIGERPDEDEPRLIYADWLEDQGRAQGDWIRVQCEIARSKCPSRELVHRQALLLALSDEWIEPLRALGVSVTKPLGLADTRRGLVESVSISAKDWVEHGAEIVERLPTVRRLHIRSEGQDLPLDRVLEAVPVPSLRELDLRGYPLCPNRVRDLQGWRSYPQIESLRLASCGISLETLLALKALGLPNSLDLSRNDLGDDAFELLATGTACLKTQALDVSSNRVTDAGLSALLTAPPWFGLRKLDLSHNQVRLGQAWAATIGMPMPHLKHVDLQRNPLAAGGDVHIGDMSGFQRLKKLRLPNCGLTPVDMETILPLRVLSSLVLDSNPLGDAGIARLAAGRNFRLLRELSLNSTHAGDIAADCLAASPSLGDLQTLSLEGNRLSEPARRVLLERFGSRVKLSRS